MRSAETPQQFNSPLVPLAVGILALMSLMVILTFGLAVWLIWGLTASAPAPIVLQSVSDGEPVAYQVAPTRTPQPTFTPTPTPTPIPTDTPTVSPTPLNSRVPPSPTPQYVVVTATPTPSPTTPVVEIARPQYTITPDNPVGLLPGGVSAGMWSDAHTSGFVLFSAALINNGEHRQNGDLRDSPVLCFAIEPHAGGYGYLGTANDLKRYDGRGNLSETLLTGKQLTSRCVVSPTGAAIAIEGIEEGVTVVYVVYHPQLALTQPYSVIRDRFGGDSYFVRWDIHGNLVIRQGDNEFTITPSLAPAPFAEGSWSEPCQQQSIPYRPSC